MVVVLCFLEIDRCGHRKEQREYSSKFLRCFTENNNSMCVCNEIRGINNDRIDIWMSFWFKMSESVESGHRLSFTDWVYTLLHIHL